MPAQWMMVIGDICVPLVGVWQMQAIVCKGQLIIVNKKKGGKEKNAAPSIPRNISSS